MIKIKKKLFSILLLMFVLILLFSACSNEKDLSSYPDGVQNGTVSAEYYDKLSLFLVDYVDYFSISSELVVIKHDDPSKTNDSDFVKKYKDTLNVFDKRLNGFVESVKPKTEADKEIHKKIELLASTQVSHNKKLMKQLLDGDNGDEMEMTVSLSFIKNLWDSATKSIEEHKISEMLQQ